MPTKIQWCDESWNIITGCEPISIGCKNCYARRMFSRNLWDYDFTPGTFHADRLDQPKRWKKPRKIFVCSMGDIAHPDVGVEALAPVFEVFRECPRHTFMLLTKRPENMRALWQCYIHPIPDNVWIGVTAENQKMADERIPVLLDIPAKVRFVSIEPMLGPVRLDQGNFPDWVIAGPETGPGKRECKASWLIDVDLQCDDAGVPFFLKKHADGRLVNDSYFQQFPVEKPKTGGPSE